MSSKTKLFIIGGLVLCIIVLLLLCVPRSSSGLSEEKFVELYVQISIAKEMFAADSVKLKEEKERIFEQAGVTQNEMDDFVKRKNQEPQEWSRVWKKIVEELKKRRQDFK